MLPSSLFGKMYRKSIKFSRKLFSSRNELIKHPEDVEDKEAQIATRVPAISSLFNGDIFIFYFPTYLVIVIY